MAIQGGATKTALDRARVLAVNDGVPASQSALLPNPILNFHWDAAAVSCQVVTASVQNLVERVPPSVAPAKPHLSRGVRNTVSLSINLAPSGLWMRIPAKSTSSASFLVPLTCRVVLVSSSSLTGSSWSLQARLLPSLLQAGRC